MAKQRGLGKGLSVLIPTEATLKNEPQAEKSVSSKQPVSTIKCDLLKPNPFQPRRSIEDSQLDELVSSIKEHGVIQPILVRKKDDSWEVVAEERRWKAAQLPWSRFCFILIFIPLLSLQLLFRFFRQGQAVQIRRS